MIDEGADYADYADDEVWEDLEFDGIPEERGRRRLPLILAIAVVAAAVVGFGPHWLRSLSNPSSATGGSGLTAIGAPGSSTEQTTAADPGETSTTVSTSTSAAPATAVPAATAPATAVPATTATAPSTTATAPATTTPATGAPATDSGAVAADNGVAVTTLQIVPALRGVVVDIDGQQFVSDADGVISIPPSRQRGVATVIGIADRPSLRRVGFLQWADGDRRTVRSLDALSGPVVEIGFTLSYRVVVQVPGDGPAVVRFTSEAGPVSLASGAAQWVPAAQAISAPDGLSTQQFSYVVGSYDRGGVSTPVASQTFLSSPEALWNVT